MKLIAVFLLALVLGCASPPKSQDSHAYETWTVVVKKEQCELALGWKYEGWSEAFQAKLRGIFPSSWAIRFRFTTGRAPAVGNVIEIGNGPPVRPGAKSYTVGMSVRIDEWNKVTDRLMLPNCGVFVNAVNFAWHTLTGRSMTREEASTVLAAITAHEIGHALGLYHFSTRRPYVMGVGHLTEVKNPYYFVWAPQSWVYLRAILTH